MNKEVVIPKELRNDEIARLFYREIKATGRGVGNEYIFCRDCLNASDFIRKNGVPDSTDDLRVIMEVNFNQFSKAGYEESFLTEVFKSLEGVVKFPQ